MKLRKGVAHWIWPLLLVPLLAVGPRPTPVSQMPFTSPPAAEGKGPFSFIVYGDVQGNHKQGHDALVQQMLQQRAVLVFNTGDMSPDQGKNYDRHFYPAARKLGERVAFFPSPGNHDVAWGSPVSRYPFQVFFKQAYDYLAGRPGNEHLLDKSGQRLWYTLLYRNALFIVLDSNFFIQRGHYRRTHSLTPYDNYGAEQLVWVRRLLEESRRNQEIQARFVFFHHSPLVSDETQPLPLLGLGGHPEHREMVMNQKVPANGMEKEAYLLDLFRYYGVTAVFTGHEHYYERWREVIQEKGRPLRVINWIVSGLGEVKPRGHPEYEAKKINELLTQDQAYRGYLERISLLNPDWSAKLTHAYPTEENQEARFHNYVLVSVNGAQIRFETKDSQGRVRDAGIF